jgi:hypothetical protein
LGVGELGAVAGLAVDAGSGAAETLSVAGLRVEVGIEVVPGYGDALAADELCEVFALGAVVLVGGQAVVAGVVALDGTGEVVGGVEGSASVAFVADVELCVELLAVGLVVARACSGDDIDRADVVALGGGAGAVVRGDC